MTTVEELQEFYRCQDAGKSLFDIWESGGANGDSVTPATWSEPYRRWMTALLCELLDAADTGALLSVGCGNAAVEAAVAAAGHRVLCVDVLDRAVRIARAKGLEAVVADVRTWRPQRSRWGVVYADGLLGHLYEPADGLAPVLKHLHGWLAPGRGTLVVSNDAAATGPAQSAPGVPFFWLSAEYLVQECRAAGFDDVVCRTYTYRRPVSGPRDRLVVTARIH